MTALVRAGMYLSWAAFILCTAWLASGAHSDAVYSLGSLALVCAVFLTGLYGVLRCGLAGVLEWIFS